MLWRVVDTTMLLWWGGGGSKCSEGRCLAGKSWAGSCAESGRGTSGVTALAAPGAPRPLLGLVDLEDAGHSTSGVV